MAYWAAVRFQLKYERLALHFLRLSGFEVYVPAPARATHPAQLPRRGHATVVSWLRFRCDRASVARRAPSARYIGPRHERWRTRACPR